MTAMIDYVTDAIRKAVGKMTGSKRTTTKPARSQPVTARNAKKAAPRATAKATAARSRAKRAQRGATAR